MDSWSTWTGYKSPNYPITIRHFGDLAKFFIKIKTPWTGYKWNFMNLHQTNDDVPRDSADCIHMQILYAYIGKRHVSIYTQ